MKLDWSISVGNILTALVFLFGAVSTGWKIYNAFARQAVVFEGLLKEHTNTLISHAGRMEKQDELLLRIIGDVQRLIGRMEVSQSAGIHLAAADAARVLETAVDTAAVKIEIAAAAAAAAAAAKVLPRNTAT